MRTPTCEKEKCQTKDELEQYIPTSSQFFLLVLKKKKHQLEQGLIDHPHLPQKGNRKKQATHLLATWKHAQQSWHFIEI